MVWKCRNMSSQTAIPFAEYNIVLTELVSVMILRNRTQENLNDGKKDVLPRADCFKLQPVSYHPVCFPASVRVRVPLPFRHVPHNSNIPRAWLEFRY
jgi:hypothetical protein